MNRNKYLTIIGMLLICCWACKGPKKKKWTSEQKTKWRNYCLLLVDSTQAANSDIRLRKKAFCDCMLEVTVNDYTPDEAFKFTDDQNLIRFYSCDFRR
ncbi:MAG: hypothetical protein MI784_11455 [Cytophagales bacterium]|nr:hypothetical protein [Cytophagales bacterium]